MPIDALAWTETIAGVLRDCAADARKVSATGQVELRITGTATPRAKKELRRWAGGWWKTPDFEAFAAVAGDFTALLYAG